MTTTAEIIHALDLQISRLTQARALLRNGNHLASTAQVIVTGGGTVTSHPITFPMPKLAEHFTKRADDHRRPRRPRSRRELSPAARDRISEAQKKRWRRYHREKKAGAA